MGGSGDRRVRRGRYRPPPYLEGWRLTRRAPVCITVIWHWNGHILFSIQKTWRSPTMSLLSLANLGGLGLCVGCLFLQV